MNILLTGVAGFIASKVAEFLLDDGHSVVGLDNMNHAYDVRLKEWRLARLQRYPNFTFHRVDISHYPSLQEIFSSRLTPHTSRSHVSPFDAVINLAARAGVRQSVENTWVHY